MFFLRFFQSSKNGTINGNDTQTKLSENIFCCSFAKDGLCFRFLLFRFVLFCSVCVSRPTIINWIERNRERKRILYKNQWQYRKTIIIIYVYVRCMGNGACTWNCVPAHCYCLHIWWPIKRFHTYIHYAIIMHEPNVLSVVCVAYHRFPSENC